MQGTGCGAGRNHIGTPAGGPVYHPRRLRSEVPGETHDRGNGRPRGGARAGGARGRGLHGDGRAFLDAGRDRRRADLDGGHHRAPARTHADGRRDPVGDHLGADGKKQTFAATQTETVGTYRANVTFPSAGTWNYAVNDGFPVAECAMTHFFAPVEIGGAAGGAAGGGGGDSGTGGTTWILLAGAGVALVGGTALMLARRRPTQVRDGSVPSA